MAVLAFFGKVALVYADLLLTPVRIVRNELRSMGLTLKNPDPWSWECDEAPDVDCYTLPNGDCVAPTCRLHDA